MVRLFDSENPSDLPVTRMGPKPRKAQQPEKAKPELPPLNPNSPASYLARHGKKILDAKERAQVVEYQTGYLRLQNLMIALGPDATAERYKARKKAMIDRGDVAALEALPDMPKVQDTASHNRNAIYQRMTAAFTQTERKLVYRVLDRAADFFEALPHNEVERQKAFCAEIGVDYRPCPATVHLISMAATARNRAASLKADKEISSGEANLLMYFKNYITEEELAAIKDEAMAAALKQPMPVEGSV